MVWQEGYISDDEHEGTLHARPHYHESGYSTLSKILANRYGRRAEQQVGRIVPGIQKPQRTDGYAQDDDP